MITGQTSAFHPQTCLKSQNESESDEVGSDTSQEESLGLEM